MQNETKRQKFLAWSMGQRYSESFQKLADYGPARRPLAVGQGHEGPLREEKLVQHWLASLNPAKARPWTIAHFERVNCSSCL